MQLDISNTSKYVVLAGTGNDLKRYVINGDKLKAMFVDFERIPYIGLIECFECYVKNPETGEGGWEIEYIEGVKEKIATLYPHFDCFITQGYPLGEMGAEEFYSLNHKDDYELVELAQ